MTVDSKHPRIRMINLKMVGLRWMLQDDNQFCDLIQKFKDLKRPTWFGNPLLIALFKTHWKKVRLVIMKRGLFPFIIYFITQLVFTQYVSTSSEGQVSTDVNNTLLIVAGVPLLLAWAYFSYYELIQIRGMYRT